MITLMPNVDPSLGHSVTCVKKIGSFVEGEKYHVAMQKCTGKKYKSIDDMTGVLEDRYMIFTMSSREYAYAIAEKSTLDECFEE